MASKMYIVVNKTVGMKSFGKVCAQVAHAVEAFSSFYYVNVLKHLNVGYAPQETLDLQYAHNIWSLENKTKIVLECIDSETWDLLKVAKVPWRYVVVDLGLTETYKGAETVMIFWPMFDFEVPSILKKLRLLKDLD